MSNFETSIDTSSELFSTNWRHHRGLLDDFKSRLKDSMLCGGEANVTKHHKRGKLLARERIEKIIDPDSYFLEFNALAADEVYDTKVPAAGIITGVGKVHGVDCLFVANDATVKGGTYFPLTVKKHLRAQEIAQKNKLPCIYLVDSGGAFLPKQAEVFPDKEHFGRIFFNQAQMSALGIPQIAVVLGSCTAGGAYVPAMSDQTIIVEGNGTIFLGGPPLVKAATGEVVDEQELGGAKVHTQVSGVADYYASDEQDAFDILRNQFKYLSAFKKSSLDDSKDLAPRYDAQDIYGILSSDTRKSFDIREIIARLVDRSEFEEFKQDYGATLICCFAKLYGRDIGIIANNGILFSESSMKGAHFIELCTQRNIPLYFYKISPASWWAKNMKMKVSLNMVLS